MSKNARIAAMVMLVFGGLLYWYQFRGGTGGDLDMEQRAVARGEGFEVAVPAPFLVVTDDRMPVPEGAVALAKPTEDRERMSSIIVVRVPDERRLSDPGSADECATTGQTVGGGQGLTLTGTAIVDAPFGKTCEIGLAEGDAFVGRMVIAYRGDDQWAITCRLEAGDQASADACQAVVDGLQFIQ